MKRSGRQIAIASGALAVGTAIVVGFLLRERALEEWYLYRLRTGGDEAKVSALRWFEDHGTERAWIACEEMLLDLWPKSRERPPFSSSRVGSMLTSWSWRVPA